eukprot:jgi/Tetstr1/429789/TSEL_019656.t1
MGQSRVGFAQLAGQARARPARLTSVRVHAKKKGGSAGGFSKRAREQAAQRAEGPKPTPEQLKEQQTNSQYDDIVAKGGEVYAAFVRLKGPGPGPDGKCQWFPVGPIAVESPKQIESALWNAEKPLVAAVKKMYPQVYMKSVETGLEIGYRLRDAPQMTEAEIKAGGNPFENVTPLVSADEKTVEVAAVNPLKEMFGNFEKIFTGR